MMIVYFYCVENDYLHKINVEQLSKELNLSVEEIAKLAGIAEARNLGKWGQDKPNGSRPNYNALIKLLKNGATVETLFGVDYKGPIKNGFKILPELLSKPEFLKGQDDALKDFEERIERRIIEKLKEKGIINDQNEKK